MRIFRRLPCRKMCYKLIQCLIHCNEEDIKKILLRAQILKISAIKGRKLFNSTQSKKNIEGKL